MKRVIIIFLSFILFSCSKWGVPESSVHSGAKRIAPFFFEISYDAYNQDFANQYGRTVCDILRGGACSVVRNGSIIGRNFDYYYADMAEFLIRVPAAPGRFASIGVAASVMDFTDGFVSSGQSSRFYDYLPYATVDGINEKGVYCSINTVPTGDLGYTNGTNPGKDDLCFPIVVRYLLDNCSSALEACRTVEKMNVFSPYISGECHFFVADQHETYVIEFIDNKAVYGPLPDGIMTNFYLLHDGFTPHSQGIERYDILKENYDCSSDVEGMASLLQSVKYSYIYDLQKKPFWYSDYYGDKYKGKVIDINTPHDFYRKYLEKESEKYAERTRDYIEDILTTNHSSIYDISSKTLRVYVQENYGRYYEFKL